MADKLAVSLCRNSFMYGHVPSVNYCVFGFRIGYLFMRELVARHKEACVRRVCGFVLEKGQLLKLKLRAIRSGVWFRALRRIDRVLVDLTLRVSNNVRSPLLARTLLAVVERLENALGNQVSRLVETVGFQLARRLSLIGEKLGNVSAGAWAFDSGFARFLAVMHLNNSNVVRL